MSQSDKHYQDYSQQYEFLSTIEQSHYRNYERTLITLSSAFLAFSLSFLGLIRKHPASGGGLPPLDVMWLLGASWVLFALSILSTLASFLTAAFALRIQVGDLKYLLKGSSAGSASTDNGNVWIAATCVLYAVAGVGFVAGVASLVVFCFNNMDKF